MATYTTNINLKKPAQSDKIRIADFNGNADNIDDAFGAGFGQSSKPSVNAEINSLADGIAIVSQGDVHGAITSGQFVYVRNHSTLSNGLYVANQNISANATLSSSNLDADSSGGLNALSANVATVATDVVNCAFCAMGATGSGATSVSITLPVGAMFDSLHPIFVISIYRSNNTDSNEGYCIMKIDGSSVYITKKTGLENVTGATYNSTTRVLTITCSGYRTFMVFGQRTSH